jgi:hypothetical protein
VWDFERAQKTHVIPAKAGIRFGVSAGLVAWNSIPAFAGMASRGGEGRGLSESCPIPLHCLYAKREAHAPLTLEILAFPLPLPWAFSTAAIRRLTGGGGFRTDTYK